MDYSLDGSVERLSYFLRSNFIMGRASKKVLKSIDKKVLGKLVKEVRDEFERDHNFEEDLLDIHQLLNKVRRKDVDIGVSCPGFR